MKSKIVAVTVGQDYLRKGVWCIKTLIIGKRKDGTLFWKVQNMDCDYAVRLSAEVEAQLKAQQYKVVYMFGIKDGQPVTLEQKQRLAIYDTGVS